MGLFDRLKQINAVGGKKENIPPYPPVDEQRVLAVLKQEADEAFKRLFSSGPYVYQYQSEEEENRVYDGYRDLPVDELRSKAESGDPKAQYLYGMYWAEQGEEHNAQARHWFQKSADAGNAEGALYAGFAWESGTGGERDVDAAIKYYEQAAAGGHGAYASELLYNIYIDLTKDQDRPKLEHLEKKLYWALSCAWYHQDDPEDGPLLYLISAMILNVLVMIGNEAAFSIGLEHVEEYTQKGEGPRRDFDYALMGLQCLKEARARGAVEELEPGTKPLDEADFLCDIGEFALEFKKDYALDVLQMAIQRGSDYAIAVSAIDRIDSIARLGLNRAVREQDELWRGYFGRAQACYEAALQERKEREQAHTLVALFMFQLYGVGCPENREAAVQSLKKAAALSYPRASMLLNSIERTADGKLRIRS